MKVSAERQRAGMASTGEIELEIEALEEMVTVGLIADLS
jgi:hypothetical protein